jgi:hypothetical protein
MARAPALGATSQASRRPRIEPAPLRIRAASVIVVVNAGTKEFKPWYMESTKMKLKELINKLQKLEKTESGEVSFKIALPNWAEGDKLKELNLVLIENADDVFTEIIFEKE